MIRRLLPAHVADLVVPVVLVAVLSVVATVGFASVLSSWSFLWVSIIAAVAASGVTLFAGWRRLLVGETIALSLLAWMVLGIVVVGGGPTPAGAATFFDGVVSGWAQLLTSFAPTDATPEILVLPWTIAWVAALGGGELVRSTRIPGLAALAPLMMLGVVILLTIEHPRLGLVQGAMFVLVTLVLGLVQQSQQRTAESDLTTGTAHRWRGRGLSQATGLVIVAVGLAPIVGPQLPLADANERFDLRDTLEPPFNPLDLPSPLTQVKGELADDRADDVVFRVTSDAPLQRWTLASMGAYDGRVWAIAESSAETAGQYRPVDSFFPEPVDGVPAQALDVVSATVEVVDLGGHWLPIPGQPVAIAVQAPADNGFGVRYNRVTGNVVAPTAVPDETTYEVSARPDPVVDDRRMETATIELSPSTADAEAVPPRLRTLVGDLVEGLEPGWEQVVAIRELLADSYYDTSPEAPPGHSYYRLAQFLGDTERIVGYDEQYAAAGALLLRLAGVQVRAVTGYDVPPERWDDNVAEVRAGDKTAWIEVATTEFGWVPIDVVATDTSVPEQTAAADTVEEVAIPNPPPPPPPPPELDQVEREEFEVEEEEEEENEPEEEPATGFEWTPVTIGLAAASPLLVMLVFAGVIVWLKRRRRNARRQAAEPADRVSGAWQEIMDRFHEVGVAPDATASPGEHADRLASMTPEARGELASLAAAVDRSSFHPVPPDDQVADQAWQASEVASSTLRTTRSGPQRVRDSVSLRPLRASERGSGQAMSNGRARNGHSGTNGRGRLRPRRRRSKDAT